MVGAPRTCAARRNHDRTRLRDPRGQDASGPCPYVHSCSEDHEAMSGSLVIIVLGTLILILGLRLVLQSSNAGAQSPSVTIEEFANAREALDTVFVEAAAIHRIFSTEDLHFSSLPRLPQTHL